MTRQGTSALSVANKLLIRCAWVGESAFDSEYGSSWVSGTCPPPSPPPSPCAATLSMSPSTIVLGEDITYTWSFSGPQPTHVAISLTAGCEHNDPGDCKYHGGCRTVLASESPYTMTTADWDLDPSVSWGPSWPTLRGNLIDADASGRLDNCWDYASVTLILPLPSPSPLPPSPPPSPPDLPYIASVSGGCQYAQASALTYACVCSSNWVGACTALSITASTG